MSARKKLRTEGGMKSNSPDHCDSLVIAKILQGFCQSAFNEAKTSSTNLEVKQPTEEKDAVDIRDEESISEEYSVLNNRNENFYKFVKNDKIMTDGIIKQEATSQTKNMILKKYSPHNGTEPRAVTPLLNPIQDYSMCIRGDKPLHTTPLRSPIFKYNSNEKDSKHEEMSPCLQHILHLPYCSIKTLSMFDIDELKDEQVNGRQMSNNAQPSTMLKTSNCAQMLTSQAQIPQCKHIIHNTKALLCRMEGCKELAARRTPYCKKHSGVRRCEHPECNKYAQGQTRFCIAHGGGRRCCHSGCTKAARDRYFCAAHGGGRRCDETGCGKIAVGGSEKCTAHGGGRRCQFHNCDKAAQSSSNFCVRHGGGRKCIIQGCCKVARGRTSMCMAHGSMFANK